MWAGGCQKFGIFFCWEEGGGGFTLILRPRNGPRLITFNFCMHTYIYGHIRVYTDINEYIQVYEQCFAVVYDFGFRV